MKQFIFKICIMLLAVMVTVSCGNSGSGEQSQKDGAQTESKAPSKTGTARKAKKSKNKELRTTGKKKKSVLTPTSAGSPYEILLVADEDDFHNGAVDSLYAVLTDDLEGVAQSEPCFKVSRITKNNLSKTLRLCRNIVIIKIDPSTYSTCKFKFSRDVYAAPQIVMTIQAPNALKFKNFVVENHDAIIEFFTRAELNRQIDLLKEDHQPHIREAIKKTFGCDMWAPTELTRIKTGRNFVWAASQDRFPKNVEQNLNIVVYSYPYRHANTFTEEYFVHKRDSIMKANVPGPREGMYMMTQKGFNLISDETVHGQYAQIVRGLWNIRNYDMGGPFVSVSRVDEKYQRVVVAEAFVYYPNQPKRDILKKLEAALYTLRLPDELDLEKFNYDLDEIIITPDE